MISAHLSSPISLKSDFTTVTKLNTTVIHGILWIYTLSITLAFSHATTLLPSKTCFSPLRMSIRGKPWDIKYRITRLPCHGWVRQFSGPTSVSEDCRGVTWHGQCLRILFFPTCQANLPEQESLCIKVSLSCTNIGSRHWKPVIFVGWHSRETIIKDICKKVSSSCWPRKDF